MQQAIIIMQEKSLTRPSMPITTWTSARLFG